MSNSIKAVPSVLKAFALSSSSFRILRTIPESFPPRSALRLLVLDSSFNPPTRAHLRIVSSALANRSHLQSQRVLLLLATQNADKAPKPAPFEQRLEMMAAFAQDLLDQVQRTDSSLVVDVGVTKLPYFVDKAKTIADAIEYRNDKSPNPISQLHLIGYDTLIRVLDTKYYPPDHTLESLKDLFAHHGLRVTLRADEALGDKRDQRNHVERLSLQSQPPVGVGWQPDGAQQIEIDEAKDVEDAVSSTRARKAAYRGDTMELESLCPSRVTQCIAEMQPYRSKS